MWKVLLINLISLTIVKVFGNESFFLANIPEIVKSANYTDVDPTCKIHFKNFTESIFKEKWAFQMIDSITKFPDGILLGHYQIPGHFDECVEAEHNDGLFTGKHCMVTAQIPIAENKIISNITRKNSKFKLSYGVCIPSTCSSTDLKMILQSIEEFKFVEFDLIENDCSTKEFRPLRTEDWVTISVIIGVVSLAVASTIYEFTVKFIFQKEKTNPLWSSFSLYKNTEQLFKISQNSSQLKCLHGIRFLSMTWVILGHSYFTALFGASINTVKIPEYLNDKSFIPISNAFVSVDSFFFLSGLLVCLVFFRDISKKGSFDVPVAFIHRYLRLTPPFALLTLIQSTIISRIGNGPFWNTKLDATEKICREYWWSGILYVQNYVSPSSMCLGQSWYLSADMQMYWLSPFILYPILIFPIYAPFFLLLLILIAAFTNFTIAFQNDLLPNFSMNFGEATITQLKLEYAPFHTRMAPWLIGLGTGYIICGLQAKKIRFNLPRYMLIIGWLASACLLGGSIFGISRFLNSPYTSLEAALYLAFHRLGWALGLSWVVVACIAGYGGIINTFLSWDIFQPLAKISYCNFLIHMMLQNYRIFSSRTNQYLRHFEIVYAYFGDLLMSNLIGIPLVLLFEFPFVNLDRYFLQKLKLFPYPPPKNKISKEEVIETKEKLPDTSEEIGTGKINPAYARSTFRTETGHVSLFRAFKGQFAHISEDTNLNLNRYSAKLP